MGTATIEEVGRVRVLSDGPDEGFVNLTLWRNLANRVQCLEIQVEPDEDGQPCTTMLIRAEDLKRIVSLLTD